MKKVLAVFALLASMCLATGAQASDAPGYGLVVGGMVNADMGWQILGKDSNFANNSDSTIANFFASVNSDSYLRATYTSADKATGAVIEFGLFSAVNADNNGSRDDGGAYLRYAYGWWNVGSCKLLVGQMDGRLADGGTLQALGDMKSGKGGSAGFGFIGATRNPKVALQVDVNDNVGFEIAIGQAGAESTIIAPSSIVADSSSSNSYLPRLEAVVDFTFDNFTFGLGGGISYQEAKAADAWNNFDYDDSVLSYLLWVPVEYSNGPFTVVLNAHFGQNVDTDWTGENTTDFDFYTNPNGIYGGQPGSLPVVKGTGSGYEIENTTQWGVGLDFNFAVTDKLTLGLGGGVTYLQNDGWDVDGGKDNYTRWTVYVAAPYAITDNFTIQPELAYYNYGDLVGVDTTGFDNAEAGDEWLLGVHFQFLF